MKDPACSSARLDRMFEDQSGRRAYVLVNNRAEGNAPLTVQALSDLLQA